VETVKKEEGHVEETDEVERRLKNRSAGSELGM